MNIKGKLTIVGILPLLLAVVYGLSVYLGQRHLFELRETAHMADAIEGELDQLESTAFEYFEQLGERPRQQSHAAFNKTGELLQIAQTLFPGAGEKELLEEVAARLGEARWSFNEFETLHQQELNSIQQAYARDVAQRLNIELRSLSPLIRTLHKNAHQDIQAFGKQLWMMELGLLVVASLLVLALMTPVLYRIRTSLQALSRGTRELGKGELSRAVELQGDDEFSRLARDFNEMARRLAAAEAARARRTEELEVAIKDLEGFSYSVSHDLRAPLRAIDGFISILVDEYGDSLDDEAKRLFGIVTENAGKMSQLIDDILALSRAGRLQLEPMQVDMEALVDEVWRQIAGETPGEEVRFQRGRLPGASCDVRAMRNVWQNLLDNALKFTRERRPALIEVSAEVRGDFVFYQVKDNGAGFNPGYQDKLFALFQRLHGMDEFEGTGVGLCIVKRLVEKHGGEITGSGAVDEGASFTFSLPLKPNTDQESSQPSAGMPGWRPD